MLLSYSTGSYVDYNFYTKTEPDTFLANKLSNIGDIELPGMLDIGTSGYTNSRIRCNADIGGYIGYAELRAATSYDMFLNLSTTYPNGGWVYFKINVAYIQLSGSVNKVNIYKDTSISGNLEVGAGAVTSNIKAFASHNGNTSSCELIAVSRDHGKFRFNTGYGHGTLYVVLIMSISSDWLIGIMESTFISRQQELQMTDLKKTK